MKYVIICEAKKITLSENAKLANGFFDRLLGLMFKQNMNDFDSMLFMYSMSIHTCFMKFNLDIIFLDASNNIIKIISNMKPWRMTGIYLKSSKVIEFKAGTIDPRISIGDKLTIKEQQCLN